MADIKRRRLFTLFPSILLFFTKSTHSLEENPIEPTYTDETREHSVLKFSKEMFVDNMGEGEWSIAIRLVVIGEHRKKHLHIVLQIADNYHFHDVIAKKVFIIKPGAPYWIKTRFHKQGAYETLYTRFIILETKDRLQTKSLEPTSIVVSDVKELT